MFEFHNAINVHDDPNRHVVLGTPLDMEPGEGQELIYFAAGCYWGVEKIFWETPGVVATAVGFMGGHADHPTYRQVCAGGTGHLETVRVVYDTSKISTGQIIATFFEIHDPTQGDRQGGDIGHQYHSAIWTTTDEQYDLAVRTREAYHDTTSEHGFGAVTTHIATAADGGQFWFAEDSHQGYLFKNPDGYQCHSRTGYACPVLKSRS